MRGQKSPANLLSGPRQPLRRSKPRDHSVRRVDEEGLVTYRRLSDGVLHREDGPAVEDVDGTREWRRDGLLHREDGPAIERPDGTKEWWRDGLVHREDGPAVQFENGATQWFQNGQRHRDDGPAVQEVDGNCEWWLDGTLFNEESWRQALAAKNKKN
jgi:hypothetical protein